MKPAQPAPLMAVASLMGLMAGPSGAATYTGSGFLDTNQETIAVEMFPGVFNYYNPPEYQAYNCYTTSNAGCVSSAYMIGDVYPGSFEQGQYALGEVEYLAQPGRLGGNITVDLVGNPVSSRLVGEVHASISDTFSILSPAFLNGVQSNILFDVSMHSDVMSNGSYPWGNSSFNLNFSITGAGPAQLVGYQNTLLSVGSATPTDQERVQKWTYLVPVIFGQTVVSVNATLDILFDEIVNCSVGCTPRRMIDLSNTVNLGGVRSPSQAPLPTLSSSGYNYTNPVPTYAAVPLPAGAWLMAGALAGLLPLRRAARVRPRSA